MTETTLAERRTSKKHRLSPLLRAACTGAFVGFLAGCTMTFSIWEELIRGEDPSFEHAAQMTSIELLATVLFLIFVKLVISSYYMVPGTAIGLLIGLAVGLAGRRRIARYSESGWWLWSGMIGAVVGQSALLVLLVYWGLVERGLDMFVPTSMTWAFIGVLAGFAFHYDERHSNDLVGPTH